MYIVKIKDNDITKYYNIFNYLFGENQIKSLKLLQRVISLKKILNESFSEYSDIFNVDESWCDSREFIKDKNNNNNFFIINRIDIKLLEINVIEFKIYLFPLNTRGGQKFKEIIKDFGIEEKSNLDFLNIKPKIEDNRVMYFYTDFVL